MSQVFSGCRAILKVGDKTMGWATGVSGTREDQQVPIEVLGQVDVAEYVTTGRRVSGNMSYVRLVDEDLVSQGLLPAGGATDAATVVDFPTMTMQVEDAITQRVLFQLEGLKISSATWSVDPRGIVGTNCSFVALKMKFGSELGG